MRKNSFLLSLFIFLTFSIIFFLADSGIGTIWSSPNRTFNVTPDTIYLNWTNNYNSSFLVFVNDTYNGWFNVTIDNATAVTQTIPYSLNFNYTSGAYSCGVGTIPCAKLLVHNETGDYVTASKNLTNISTQNNETFYLINNESSSLWAGRYGGIVRIYNTSIATEYANITIVLDIPVQINNNTGTGSFSGTLPINTSIYQSFYFNTTSVPNATAVKINITGWTSSQDVDLFLFDNSSTPQLLAKSINKSSTEESLAYSFLPSTEKMWEIRVYGNDTSPISYSGNIFFTTLNSSIRTLDFSVRNVSYTNQSTITLSNVGNLNISNVLESKKLYNVIRFAGNGTRNFTFLVPDSTVAQKVKVSLNWTVSNSSYLLNVYKPDKSLAFSSVNKSLYANATNANLEEYGETTDISQGYWTVEVKNSTNATAIDPYNVTAYIYVNASNWIVTNYTNSTSGVTFNATNSTSIQVNLTIPNTTMNGLYEGSLQYLDMNGVGIKIPISVNITAPTLLVNGTLISSAVTVFENINATLLRVLNITLNNTGSYDISSITTTNSTSLNNGGYYINFSYQTPTSLSAGRSGILNITMNLNTSITSDNIGVYSGWIILNTNASSYQSAPYPNFTLNINFNLTNLLDVRVTGINTGATTNWISNVSTLPQNVTIQYLNLYYINGTTQITGTSLFNYTNISSVRLYHANANYWTSYLNKSETGFVSNPFEVNPGDYRFNITIPANLPGGNYQVHVSLTNANGKLQGESSNETLTVNNTGLLMSTNFTGCSFGSSCYPSITLNPGNSTGIYVNVTNYGPLTSAGTSVNNITFSNPCTTYYTVSAPTYANCPTSSSFAPTGYSSNCTAYWTITATSTPGTCTGNIVGNGYWFNPYGINITITVPNTTTSTSTTGSTTTTTTTTTSGSSLTFSKADTLIPVQQNSTNSTEVQVRNSGTTNLNVTFRVEGINSAWYTVNATSSYIVSGGTAGFRITFAVGNGEVNDYLGKYNATSSSTTVTKNFTLRVLPSPQKAININDTLALYKVQMIELETEINQSRNKGLNVTLAEQKLNELKSKISQAENYTKVGDYFNANQLFPTIKSLIDDTKNELSKAKQIVSQVNRKRMWIFIGTGAGLVALGVLTYLLWPTKGYHAETDTYLSEKESLWKRLKTKLSIFRKKVKKND